MYQSYGSFVMVKAEVPLKFSAVLLNDYEETLRRYVEATQKSYHPKRNVVFQPSFFRGYAKLPGSRKLYIDIKHNL